MKKINPNARYHETNEWATLDGNILTIGITDFAQTVFGNVVEVEFPEVGIFISKNEKLLLIESSKVSTEVFSPLSGKIIQVNEDLEEHPEWLNEAPYGKGWLVKMEMKDVMEWEGMMTAEAYAAYMSGLYNKV